MKKRLLGLFDTKSMTPEELYEKVREQLDGKTIKQKGKPEGESPKKS